MVFCPNCGKQIDDGVRFCTYCGAKVPVGANAPHSVAQTRAEAEPAYAQAPTPARPSHAAPQVRRKPRPALIAVLAVAIVAVVGFGVYWFVLRPAEQEQTSTNATLGYAGAVASTSEYDYFYSTLVGGIARATSDGGTVELVRAVDSGTYGVSSLALDDDTLFYVLSDYSSGLRSSDELHSMKTDGSDDKVIFSGTPDVEGVASWTGIGQVAIFDHTLYLAFTADGGASDRTLVVISMDEDGATPMYRCKVEGINSTSAILTSNGIYYTDKEYIGSGDGVATIWRCSYDGGEPEAMYTSQIGAVSGLALCSGRLCFKEFDGSGTGDVITSIALDGTDAKTLYTAPQNTSFVVEAGSSEGVYLQSYDTTRQENQVDICVWDLVRVGLDGATQTVASELTIYNPTFTVLGDRVLMLENGQYFGSAGNVVVSVAADGSGTFEYDLGA